MADSATYREKTGHDIATVQNIDYLLYTYVYSEPPNNGHIGDECFVHYSEVVPSSEVLTCIQLLAGGTQFVHCREVVRSSECPLSEVPLYVYII